MSREFVRIVFAIWLCWYLTGPLAETFDFWDTPQEEMGDIASSVDGALVWAAAAICVAILLSRQFRNCCTYLAEVRLLDLPPSPMFTLPVDLSLPEGGPIFLESPQLRI